MQAPTYILNHELSYYLYVNRKHAWITDEMKWSTGSNGLADSEYLNLTQLIVIDRKATMEMLEKCEANLEFLETCAVSMDQDIMVLQVSQ